MAEVRFCSWCGGALAPRHDGERARLACAAEGCGYVFYDNPLPVAAAVVEHEGHVVLVRSPGWPPGWFGLVTGFIERGESPAEAALREVKEELGLDAELAGFIGVYEFTLRNELIVAYHVRASGPIVMSSELEAIKRVPVDKLRPWPLGTGRAVADWLAARGNPG